jgi:hypothetical protein
MKLSAANMPGISAVGFSRKCRFDGVSYFDDDDNDDDDWRL